eukprot:scaffold205736_cov32-Tisochrysis_lutea.AAC.8
MGLGDSSRASAPFARAPAQPKAAHEQLGPLRYICDRECRRGKHLWVRWDEPAEAAAVSERRAHREDATTARCEQSAAAGQPQRG